MTDAPSVVARYFPDYREIYARRGWTMFDSIDRVYDASKAAKNSASSAGPASGRSSTGYDRGQSCSRCSAR